MNTDKQYMEDAKGRLVPIELIPEIDLTRDALVQEIVATAKAESQRSAALKSQMLSDVEAFVELSVEKYGKALGGRKGNVTLNSFDGKYRVLRAIEETISFDERLQAAKALINECLREWTQDSRSELRALIDDAFQVDQQGNINIKRILSLRRLDIQDERWKQAMQAISDSVQVCSSKTYIRVYARDNQGKYQHIAL